MIKKLILPSIFISLLITSCKNQVSKSQNESSNIFEKLEKVPDSVKVGNITILNLFKNQILAHQSQYDSLRIVQKVYQPHKELWNKCYGMIFGEENASKFNNPKGMVDWNKKLYPDNKDFFDNRTSELLNINLEKTLKQNLQKFEKLVSYQPKAKISILFTPLQGIGFGGCSAEEFAFELNNKEYNVNYTIEKEFLTNSIIWFMNLSAPMTLIKKRLLPKPLMKVLRVISLGYFLIRKSQKTKLLKICPRKIGIGIWIMRKSFIRN